MKKSLDDCITEIKKSGQAKKLDFPEIKKEIDELMETESQFRSFSPGLFQEELRANADTLVRMRLLCSQLKERSEINEKLESLAYYLGQLRYSIFSKDNESLKRVLRKFLADKHTNIRSILADIQAFKRELEEIRGLFEKLSHEKSAPLDVWISHASYLESQMKLFSEIQERQKNIALNIGRLFVRTAKKQLKK
ncbi:MAG TPA: hypothetical protein VJI46_04765 [Candidatus Nanoarchaeia archaeon]|nr:hypothetical protein [Candidatus Nanoarchaeia archaeon]